MNPDKSVLKLIHYALNNSNSELGYFRETQEACEYEWRGAADWLFNNAIPFKYDRSQLYFQFKNGSRLRFFNVRKHYNLLGLRLDNLSEKEYTELVQFGKIPYSQWRLSNG